MKKEKKKEEQYINSPLNNPMLNYDVYVPGKGERIVVSILFFLIGGCVGMVFYGNLFMRDGMATTATYISNLVFFCDCGCACSPLCISCIYKKLFRKTEK